MDRENEVSNIFVISLRLIGRAGKETSGPYIEIRPAKLTNHTARTERNCNEKKSLHSNKSYRAILSCGASSADLDNFDLENIGGGGGGGRCPQFWSGQREKENLPCVLVFKRASSRPVIWSKFTENLQNCAFLG